VEDKIIIRKKIMFFKNRRIKNFKILGLIFLISLFMAACRSQQAGQSITGIDWRWSEMVETEPAAQSLVPNPQNYILRFSADGSVSITADCNMVSGSYTLDGSSLSIMLGASTMAYCGEESLDQLFLGFLSNVDSFTIENGQLVLELKGGAGLMTFNEG
jgi:heat shock protein HslJ